MISVNVSIATVKVGQGGLTTMKSVVVVGIARGAIETFAGSTKAAEPALLLRFRSDFALSFGANILPVVFRRIVLSSALQ